MSKSIKQYKDAMDKIKASESFMSRTEDLLKGAVKGETEIAIRQPNTKNPPGARTNISIGFSLKNGIERPLPPFIDDMPERKVPLPRVSLIIPMQKSAAVKPMPIPSPSSADAATPFLPANASALPRIMQLTTISGK